MRTVFLLIIVAFASLFCLPASAVDAVESANEFETVKRSLVFIYNGNLEPCSPDPKLRGEPSGTGFFVTLRVMDKNGKPTSLHTYLLVTNQHVLNGGAVLPNGVLAVAPKSSIIIRVNNAGDTHFECQPVDLRWDGVGQNVFTLAPDVDLAAVALKGVPNQKCSLFDYNMIVGDSKMKGFEIREGSSAFTLGYLMRFPGLNKNFPVSRFGRLALVDDESWYPSQRGMPEKAYLFEFDTTYGSSGSPVFLDSLQLRVVKNQLQYRLNHPLILGVIKGFMTTDAPVTMLHGVSAKAPIGLAAIEPGENLRLLLRKIADRVTMTQGVPFYLDDRLLPSDTIPLP